MGDEPAQRMQCAASVTGAVGRVIDTLGFPGQPGLKRGLTLAQIMKQTGCVAELAISERRREPRRALADFRQMIDQGLPCLAALFFH
jgi:hypothetical protein